MMYVISAIAGAAYGFGTCLLKYLLLWWKIIHPKDDKKIKAKHIVVRMIVSYALNVVILLIAFLLLRRNIIALDFTVTLISVAFGMTISSKVFSMEKVNGCLLEEQMAEKDSLGGLH